MKIKFSLCQFCLVEMYTIRNCSAIVNPPKEVSKLNERCSVVKNIR